MRLWKERKSNENNVGFERIKSVHNNAFKEFDKPEKSELMLKVSTYFKETRIKLCNGFEKMRCYKWKKWLVMKLEICF